MPEKFEENAGVVEKATGNKNPMLHNVLWLFFDKAYGALLTLYVFSLMATYFGKELFGVWNYLFAFASFLPAFASLGLNFVIVKYIKERPLLSQKIVGNTLVYRFLAGLFFSFVLLAIYWAMDLNQEQEFIWCFVLLLVSQILLNTNVFVYENEAKLTNRKTVVARNVALTLGAILKFGLIYLNKGIVLFALVNALEFALFFMLSYRFSKVGLEWEHLKVNRKIMGVFTKEGLPLLLSGMVVILYLRIDQVLIAYLQDNASVGIYSAASRITEMFYAAPVIITNVFYPKILEHKNNVVRKHLLMDRMNASVIILSLLVVLAISFLSEWIINILYDPTYIESAGILKIYAWSLLFMGLLVGSSKHLLVIGRNDIILYRGVFGLVSNVVLNFILIPKYGIEGAAWATLISYFIAAYLSNIFFKDLRPLMITQLTSIFVLFRTQNTPKEAEN